MRTRVSKGCPTIKNLQRAMSETQTCGISHRDQKRGSKRAQRHHSQHCCALARHEGARDEQDACQQRAESLCAVGAC